MSIQNRLTVAIALVLLLTLVMLGAVLVRETRATLVAQVDDKILAVAARAEGKKSFPSNGEHPDDRDDNTSAPPKATSLPTPAVDVDLYEQPVARFVFGPNGNVLVNQPSGFADDPQSPPRLPPIPSGELLSLAGRIVTAPAVDGSHSYRMLVQRTSEGDTWVTAASLASAEAAVARLVQTLLTIGGSALVIATLASWWIIRRGLQPVDRMVDTATAIAAGDLSRRVPNPDLRTELGRLGSALNVMLNQIEQAATVRAETEERLRRFVADAAHELRTPLTSLRGYAELYRQGALPDDSAVQNAMRRIEAEGGRMARLVDDLLLLARLDQQRALEVREVDISALVREAIDDFRVVEPTRAITLEEADEASVRGDHVRLRQVVDNLLTNARNHTPAGSPVYVAVRRTDREVLISVKDEGPGITADDQARVFERFWRADAARTRSRGGTGLGLAIVASIVESHGGALNLHSAPGRGSTFTISLPLTPAS